MINHTTGKPPVILIVEDSVVTRMEMADLLTEAGFRVIAEVNADHALTVLAVRSDINAVVADVKMPGSIDGTDLVQIVEKAWPSVGIVVASGKVTPAPDELPSKARFLSKPYPPSALVNAVKAALASAERTAAFVDKM